MVSIDHRLLPLENAAQLAGLVDQLREQNPNTLFLSAGDNIGASTFVVNGRIVPAAETDRACGPMCPPRCPVIVTSSSDRGDRR